MDELFFLEVLVPLLHITTFIVLVSVCFLFHRDTLGLLLAFIFVFDWGSYANRDLILEVLNSNPHYWITYVGGGTVLVFLAGLGVWATVKRRKTEQERLESVRLQGVLEMAGAACHELSQPLQVITGLSQLMAMNITEDHPFYDKVSKMNEQADRVVEVINKIMNITKYETRDYLSRLGKIIDIEKSSKDG